MAGVVRSSEGYYFCNLFDFAVAMASMTVATDIDSMQLGTKSQSIL